MMKKTDMIHLAHQAARTASLDPILVCSLVSTESGWNSWAMRYEPAFFERYIVPMQDVRRFGPVSLDTEKIARATSFGLCQVMGQVAREHGFRGTHLVELCDPETGLLYGCKRLRQAMDRKKNDVHLALLDYNGGGDKAYPERVLSHRREFA